MQTRIDISKYDIEKIKNARKIFRLQVKNGVAIFDKTLKGSVGRNADNFPEDLRKVQERLVQLGILEEYHQENPEYFEESIDTGNIPFTIEAIEYFQLRHQAEFWVNTKERSTLVGTSQYKLGKIMPHCITFKLLKELTEYTLKFPLATGELKKAKFQNFPHTIFTEYYDGVAFAGSVELNFDKKYLEKLKLSENALLALEKVISILEEPDTVQSFGTEVFAFGILPFRAWRGNLAALLALIKYKKPKVFQEYFLQFGIDVIFQTQGKLPIASSAEILIVNPDSIDEKYFLTGKNALLYLQKNKQLHGVFIRAGHSQDIMNLQIEAVVRLYFWAMLSKKWHLDMKGHLFWNIPVKNLFKTPEAMAGLLYLAIDKGLEMSEYIIKPIFEEVASSQELFAEEKFTKINMKEVIEKLIQASEAKHDYVLAKKLGTFVE